MSKCLGFNFLSLPVAVENFLCLSDLFFRNMGNMGGVESEAVSLYHLGSPEVCAFH